jgi:hypothetical protein
LQGDVDATVSGILLRESASRETTDVARKSLPAHLRKSGPGTGGRNWVRDLKICKLKKATGATNTALGKQYNLSRETIRHIIATGERNTAAGRTRWMSTLERRIEAAKDRSHGKAHL